MKRVKNRQALEEAMRWVVKVTIHGGSLVRVADEVYRDPERRKRAVQQELKKVKMAHNALTKAEIEGWDMSSERAEVEEVEKALLQLIQ